MIFTGVKYITEGMDIPLRVLLPLAVIYVMEGLGRAEVCLVKRGVMVTIFPVGSDIQKNPDTQTGPSKISGIGLVGLSLRQI